jgi:hypothetical protein
MSINATYTDATGVHKAMTVKLTRIWGSKDEGWNAWVGVFKKAKDISPLATFSIKTDYVEDVNPYKALYAEVAKLTFLSNLIHDVIIEVPAKVVDPKESGLDLSILDVVKKITKKSPKN